MTNVEEKLYEMNYDEIADLWNDFCREYNWDEDIIYPMSNFDEVFREYSPTELVNMWDCGNTTRDRFFAIKDDLIITSDNPFNLMSDSDTFIEYLEEQEVENN